MWLVIVGVVKIKLPSFSSCAIKEVVFGLSPISWDSSDSIRG